MKKYWLVFKNEFIYTITRKSFVITLLLLPVTSFIILLIISGLQKTTGLNAGKIINNLFAPRPEAANEGFVDYSGMLVEIPPQATAPLQRFNSEGEAQKALAIDEISAYYLLEKDFLETGDVVYVRSDYNPLGGISQADAIHALIAYNLTNQNQDLAFRIEDPLNVNVIDVSNKVGRDISHPLTFIIPYVITFLFYIVILTSASLLLNGITNEKTNRVLEILLTSLAPKQLLTGKILALGMVGLLQTIVWLGAGLLMLRFSGQAFALGSTFQLPVSILLWGILFFLLGYAVFASLMAGIGALVPSMKEATQLTTVVIIPLIIPLMFISTLIQTPNGPLPVFLSLFPLTSPVSMMTRLAASSVPIWQILLALALLAGTAWLFLRASASLFRAQNLLSGKSVTSSEFLKALIGKQA